MNRLRDSRQYGRSLVGKIKIDSLNLRSKLILAFVLVAFLVAVTGLVGYHSLSSINGETHHVVKSSERMDGATQVIISMNQEQEAVRKAELGNEGMKPAFTRASKRFKNQTLLLEDRNLNAEQQDRLESLWSQQSEYHNLAVKFFKAKAAGHTASAQQIYAKMNTMEAGMNKKAQTFEQTAQNNLKNQVTAADRTGKRSQRQILGLTVAAFIMAILIGLFVSKRIMAPVTQLSDAAVAASRGDLETQLDDHVEDDELGRMVTGFKDMQGNLRGVFSDLNDVSRNLKEGRLNQDIDTDYLGTYGEILRNMKEGNVQLSRSFREIQSTSDNLRNGEINQTIETDQPGQYGAVLENLETGMVQLSGSFDQISSASEGLRKGQLEQDIDTNQPGQYGEILEDIEDGTEQLSQSFDRIATASRGLRDGQLDQRIETDYPGEYGDVMAALRDGIGQLGDSIETVQRIADEVAESSEEVSCSTEEIEQTSEEVAKSVAEITHGTEKQSESFQDVRGEMNDMSATVEEIASSADEVSMTASMAVERCETGQQYASEATDEIQSIEARTTETAAQVAALDNEIEEISTVVETIASIAEQTNLLALNANIEAARAGDAGEGFAVVANEIKELAEETARATDEIETNIVEVQGTTAETVEGMELMSDRVENGSKTIENAIEMFDEIADVSHQVEGGVKEISDVTDEQAASSEEVVAMVDEVSRVSQRTADETSTVSAATEEQTASLSEVSGNVQHLSNLADTLHSQVSDFEVRNDALGTSTGASTGGTVTTRADGGR